jgi:hypothetical protein
MQASLVPSTPCIAPSTKCWTPSTNCGTPLVPCAIPLVPLGTHSRGSQIHTEISPWVCVALFARRPMCPPWLTQPCEAISDHTPHSTSAPVPPPTSPVDWSCLMPVLQSRSEISVAAAPSKIVGPHGEWHWRGGRQDATQSKNADSPWVLVR